MSDATADVTAPAKPIPPRFAHSKPTASLIATVLSTILITVAAVCMGFALILSLMSMKTMYVVSNSMVPAFERGDLLIVSTDYNNVAPDDIIAYDASWAEGKHVTHRVVSVEGEEIIVKGDNNATPDPPLTRDDIYGEVVAIVPNAGILLNPYTIITTTLVGLVLSYLGDWLRPLGRHAEPQRSSLKKLRQALRKNTA